MEEKKKRKRRFGDRSDGYLIRNISAMSKFMPYVMPQRCDACNTFSDHIDVTFTDKYCREKVKSGMSNFSFLHVLLAAYVRAISQRPALNRFVSGRKIYHRHKIEVNMVVKKTLAIDSPDTAIKVYFEPDDTIDEIYEKFNRVVEEVKSKPDEQTSFDKINKALTIIPGWLIRFAVAVISWLDYHRMLPKFLLNVSPFHGTMIVTSMGSLGIRPIYHHLYNFGNLPVFFAYGNKQTKVSCDAQGNVVQKKAIELKVVTDERTVDGYYYDSAFKLIKKYCENPTLLEAKPDQVFEDVD